MQWFIYIQTIQSEVERRVTVQKTNGAEVATTYDPESYSAVGTLVQNASCFTDGTNEDCFSADVRRRDSNWSNDDD